MQSENLKCKMKFKIRILNEKFKIITSHAPTNFEFKFVISAVLPHFFLLSTYAHDKKVQCYASRISTYFTTCILSF